jgi:hypothetical protein
MSLVKWREKRKEKKPKEPQLADRHFHIDLKFVHELQHQMQMITGPKKVYFLCLIKCQYTIILLICSPDKMNRQWRIYSQTSTVYECFPEFCRRWRLMGNARILGLCFARIFSPYFNRTFFQQQIHLEILEDALVRETPITLCTVFETLPFWGKYINNSFSWNLNSSGNYFVNFLGSNIIFKR